MKPDGPRCGATKQDGTTCRKAAGAGTTHLGIGRCKYHGGASPNHQVAAEKKMAEARMRTYGCPIDVEPHVALIEEVRPHRRPPGLAERGRERPAPRGGRVLREHRRRRQADPATPDRA